jgi:hypothetical protein
MNKRELINSIKQPDLHQERWHQGFRDGYTGIFPKHPSNRIYIMGWLYALGWQTGISNQLPAINDEAFFEGYESAQIMRSSNSTEPDVRGAI